eukprot:m.445098 g.445098  ORF g.445098 m.445098 type:complete len:445 (-) comp19185_c0_seq1:2224-3558(-)
MAGYGYQQPYGASAPGAPGYAPPGGAYQVPPAQPAYGVQPGYAHPGYAQPQPGFAPQPGFGYGAPAAPASGTYQVPPAAAPAPYQPPGGLAVVPGSGAPPPAAYSAPAKVPVAVKAPEPVVYTPDDQSTGHPTCTPAADFDAERDATAINDAFTMSGGLRTVINILAYRSTPQRVEIRSMYKTMYGRDLLTTIDENSTRNTQRVLQAMCRESDERDAHVIMKAFKGRGYEPDVILYILISRGSDELKAVKARYKKMFDIELEDHIKKECSGPFMKLLIGLAQANRCDWNTPVKVDKCKRDAEALYKAGEGQWGTETSEFRRILNLRSVPQLRCIFDQYSKISTHTIEESCKREMKGDLLKAVKKIIRFAQDPYKFYAREIYKSMKGLGTDDRKLVHLIVDRCEIDMVEIKKIFEKEHKATMASWIKSDTSFEYKECLLALIRES